MKGQDVMFERGLNVPDGIHNDIQFNEYRNHGTVWVTASQFIIVTLEVLALAAMYGLFGMLEG